MRHHCKWWTVPDPKPKAQIRLFCLPYAGAGASLFYRWTSFLPVEVELAALQMPGREQRLSEPHVLSFTQLTAEISRSAEPLLDRPAVFFGHSMGGLLAYEWASQLSQVGRTPAHVILSAVARPDTFVHRSRSGDDQSILERVRALGGTPPVVLNDPELMSLLLPTLRADFSVLNSYTDPSERHLPCPLTVLGGKDDSSPAPTQLEQWRKYADSQFAIRLFPGGHFFFQPLTPEFQSVIISIFNSVLC